MKKIALIFAIFFLSTLALGQTTPLLRTQALSQSVQQVLAAPNLAERREKTLTLIEEYFAFDVFAEWTLKDYWKQLSKKQRLQFLEAFRQRFTKQVLNHLARKPEKIWDFEIVSEKSDKKYSEIKCRIKKGKNSMPASLFWINTNQKWQLVDIKISAADLVVDYQGQFNKIIRDYGFDELIRRLHSQL